MTEPDPMARSEIRERYENSDEAPTDGYANYGDVNPKPHGGQWITYNDSGWWTFYSTQPAVDVGFDVGDDLPESEVLRHQYVRSVELSWQDVLTEAGLFTESALSTATALHSVDADKYGPDSLAVDSRLTWFVAAVADELAESYPYHDPVKHGEYGEILDSLGIDPLDGEW